MNADPPQNTRVELKEGIFSIFMHYTGIQGQKSDYFGLSKEHSGIHTIVMPSALRLDLVNRSVVLDAAIIPLTLEFLSDQKFKAFLEHGVHSGIITIKVSHEELRCWKTLFPALVERCRVWQHRPSCEYQKRQAIPLTVDDGKTPLCLCGNGKFPAGYMQGSNTAIPNFDYVLKKYATRVAISPVFSVSYVESCFLQDYPRDEKGLPLHDKAAEGCRRCGDAKAKGSATKGLMQCSRCKKVKYCSADCQKADWKTHKLWCPLS